MSEQVLFSLPLDRLEPVFKSWFRDVIKEMPPVQESERQDERLTRREVCKLYKISFPTLHSQMLQGLPYEKLGRKTLFRRQEVDTYFRNKKRIVL